MLLRRLSTVFLRFMRRLIRLYQNKTNLRDAQTESRTLSQTVALPKSGADPSCGLTSKREHRIQRSCGRPSHAPHRMRPYRTDRPPNTVYAEMNEAIGRVQNGHRYDQSFEECNERCHDDTVHAPPLPGASPTHNLSHLARSRMAFCATIRRRSRHIH